MPAKSGPNSSDNKGKKERILIFSAGAHIDNTYISSCNHIKPGPTKVYVLAEEEIFEKPEKQDIKESIEKLKAKIEEDKSDKKSNAIFFLKKIPELKQNAVRDAVFEIHHENPDAEYLFNVTAGTATFSVSLFITALWIGGRVCITRSEYDMDYTELKIPKISVKDLKEDEKLTILRLGKAVKNENTGNDDGWVTNSDLLKYIGELKEKENLRNQNWYSKTNQSRRMGKLIGSDLVEEKRVKGSQKQYRLTRDGIFCYKFIEMSDEKSEN